MWTSDFNCTYILNPFKKIFAIGQWPWLGNSFQSTSVNLYLYPKTQAHDSLILPISSVNYETPVNGHSLNTHCLTPCPSRLLLMSIHVVHLKQIWFTVFSRNISLPLRITFCMSEVRCVPSIVLAPFLHFHGRKGAHYQVPERTQLSCCTSFPYAKGSRERISRISYSYVCPLSFSNFLSLSLSLNDIGSSTEISSNVQRIICWWAT